MMKMHEKNVWGDYNRAVTSGDTLLIRGTIRGQRGRHPGAQWYALGIQIRNMKMGFNIHGTWGWVTFEKRMMKIYDFFYSSKSFSCPI